MHQSFYAFLVIYEKTTILNFFSPRVEQKIDIDLP